MPGMLDVFASTSSSSPRGLAFSPTPVARTMMISLLHLCKAGKVLLQALDDDRTRHAARADLETRLAVDVRVVPIEAGLLILRHVNDVVQILAGFRERAEHVVARCARRRAEAGSAR